MNASDVDVEPLRQWGITTKEALRRIEERAEEARAESWSITDFAGEPVSQSGEPHE